MTEATGEAQLGNTTVVSKKLEADIAQVLTALNKQSKLTPPQIYSKDFLTDVNNARRLAERFGKDIHYVSGVGAWMCWNGKIWERLDEDRQGYPQLLIRLAEDVANSYRIDAISILDSDLKFYYQEYAMCCESDARIRAMVKLVTGEPGVMVSYKVFDKQPFLFTCQNGTIDLSTQTFREHRREDYITKISPAVYDPAATCPQWIAFLKRIMQSHPELINYLQDLAGQCLTGEVREKAFYVAYGPRGDNGKTTFLEAVQYVLNEYGQTIPIAALIKQNNSSIPVDLHTLQGARLAYSNEPDFGDELTPGLIKQITGKDKMKTRTLHEKPIQWTPQFKLVIATNHQPKILDTSEAMWGRVKCIPFVEKIPEAEQDKQLGEKLRLEAAGILNWMIAGCKNWLANGMKEPEIIRQTVHDYRENSDKLADFFAYTFEKDVNGFVPFKITYILYQLWCINHSQRPVAEQTLPQLLEIRGYPRGRGYYESKDKKEKRDRGNYGMKLLGWLTEDLNEPKKTVSDSPCGTKKDEKQLDRVPGQRLNNTLTVILEAADTDLEFAAGLYGQMDRDDLVEAVYYTSSNRNSYTKSLSTLSTLSHDSDITTSNSVHNSVHSVQKEKEAREDKPPSAEARTTKGNNSTNHNSDGGCGDHTTDLPPDVAGETKVTTSTPIAVFRDNEGENDPRHTINAVPSNLVQINRMRCLETLWRRIKDPNITLEDLSDRYSRECHVPPDVAAADIAHFLIVNKICLLPRKPNHKWSEPQLQMQGLEEFRGWNKPSYAHITEYKLSMISNLKLRDDTHSEDVYDRVVGNIMVQLRWVDPVWQSFQTPEIRING